MERAGMLISANSGGERHVLRACRTTPSVVASQNTPLGSVATSKYWAARKAGTATGSHSFRSHLNSELRVKTQRTPSRPRHAARALSGAGIGVCQLGPLTWRTTRPVVDTES